MEHHFDVEIATKLNVNCAIIYNNIQFWTAKNKANSKHFIEGNYWTYNSVKAWNEILPYLSQKQIRTALDKLEESGFIISDSFNKAGYDRTKWYAIKGQMQLPSGANGVIQKGEPIPDNKPDNKPSTVKREVVEYDYFHKTWNSFAEKNNLKRIVKLSGSRKDKIKVRSSEVKDFKGVFLQALKMANNTSFLLGDNKNNWSISFDWLITNDSNYLKILEGNYNDR